ncbi:two-component regulator propeller domain-containing protein [Gracilimonas mengyeensis]|uniref:Two component regulator propeller n=1 Tax=Gracilimonas mengyeensis TaxID=1302730 RepID=A0A521EGS4_9BACT|nr:two-component regulator propeller domain-containing protein [Gracilimonas mengyeensis]SMO83113.1 Two component regulator propeller [Gracilimonas mengyeensis]
MMRNKLLCLLMGLVVGTAGLQAQELGEWKVYPSHSTITDMAFAGGVVYGATLGGIYMVEDEEIRAQISTMDGLYRSNPRALIYDEAGNRLFAGYIDGMIDVIEPNDVPNIERVRDINRVSRFTSRSVNKFIIYEGSLYVATSFGIVVYDMDELFVENSFLRLGDFNAGTAVLDFDIVQDTIYAATEQGVAIGALSDNLVENDSWQSYSTDDGLRASLVEQIVKVNQGVFALSSDSVFTLQDSEWALSDILNSENIEVLGRNSDGSQLAISDGNTIVLAQDTGGQETIRLQLGSTINGIFFQGETIYLGTTNEGFSKLESRDATPQKFQPTGPYLNFFNNMLVDGQTLLATSSSAFPQTDPLNPVRGYYIFEDDVWHNFNRNTNEVLRDNQVSNAFAVGQSDSAYYIGTWGGGIVEHQKSTNDITVYNENNSALSGIGIDPDYIVVPGIDIDSDGNVWATSFWSEFPLNVKLEGSDEWIPFRSHTGGDHYFNMLVDSYDQKWISLRSEGNAGLGLLVVDTGDPETAQDDQSVKLTSASNNGRLPDEKVNVIVEDRGGDIWIGTGRGIAKFVFPEKFIERSPSQREAQWLINEDTLASSRYLLRDVNVTAIAVNDANQKWIGSQSQGLWLLNAEGSRIEARYTTENSDLISNTIESISINSETGQVFVATDQGLVSLQDVPLKPVKSMDNLKVFPNPFQYSRHNQIVIEGLSGSTQVKILGVDGVVVNELEATGGRISWDGHDYNGNQLGSGVYYVVAYESSGGERGLGKVVIIR